MSEEFYVIHVDGDVLTGEDPSVPILVPTARVVGAVAAIEASYPGTVVRAHRFWHPSMPDLVEIDDDPGDRDAVSLLASRWFYACLLWVVVTWVLAIVYLVEPMVWLYAAFGGSVWLGVVMVAGFVWAARR